MFGWIKFLIKTGILLAMIIGCIIGYKYYCVYVPYYDFIYEHLYFDELKSIYAGRCASLAYVRGLYNKSVEDALTYDDIIVSPYVSFGRWMMDNKNTELGREINKILPQDNSWDSLAEAAKSIYVKYVPLDGTKYRMVFVVSDLKNAYTEKLEFNGPINDYYGMPEDMVDEWASSAFDIRSERGPVVPRTPVKN